MKNVENFALLSGEAPSKISTQGDSLAKLVEKHLHRLPESGTHGPSLGLICNEAIEVGCQGQ